LQVEENEMRMKRMAWGVGFGGLLAMVSVAGAGFILEIDTDGLDNGVLSFNPGFSFGGDTTTASQSAAASVVGGTGGDSIFGGNGVNLGDTYVFTYSPDSQPDNLVLAPGTALGEGNEATGVVGGGPGTYRVYAAWPYTENVGGGTVTYTIESSIDSTQAFVDQNFRGNAWVFLGEIEYTGGAITVTQEAGSNTFISMRAYGVLFEKVEDGPPCADVTGDGEVNLKDLNRVLALFGQDVIPGTAADANGDGQVNLGDLNLVLAQFGTSC
jgi:hypothetical protein